MANEIDGSGEKESELFPEWKEAAISGLDDALELLKIGFIEAVNLSPASDFPTADGRIFSELGKTEQEFVIKTFLLKLGFDTTADNQRAVSSYATRILDHTSGDPVEREINVYIFETELSISDGIYLHYMTVDGKRDYLAAGLDYRL